MPLRRAIRKKQTITVVLVASICFFLLRQRLQEYLCLKFESSIAASFCSFGTTHPEWNLFYHLGGNGPWIPKQNAHGSINDPLPIGCVVDQVHMLARHAARYPTKNAGIRHLALLDRLDDKQVTLTGPLSFLKSWKYFTDASNPAFENLTATGPYAGTLQARDAGSELRLRYSHLLASRPRPIVWSCGSPRDVETAICFADGFFGPQWQDQDLASLVVIPETDDRGADTLTPGDTCIRYRHDDRLGHDLGYHKLNEWQQIFTESIIERLKENAVGVHLQALDIYSMMEMCGFEVLARGHSPWCEVFTHNEWLHFEYARDLLHFYRAGPGNVYAHTLGWPYLNATAELLANDSSNDIYFSFVHDGDIVPFIAALHLLDEKSLEQELPTDRMKEDRIWSTSDTVPMGGRVILERIACTAAAGGTERFVRVFINDGLMKLPGPPSAIQIPCSVRIADFRNLVLSMPTNFSDVCGLPPTAAKQITFLHQ